MQTSNTVFTRWMMALSLVALVGCSLPESKTREDIENKDSVASFKVESVKGEVLEAKVENTFGLATRKVFAFTACLKDANERKTIGGHKFKVDEVGLNVSTDAGGCVSWTESLDYNPIADSRYLKINRTISGTGLHKGSKVLSLAVNPWNNDEKIDAVIDLSKKDVPNIITDRDEVQKLLKGLSVQSGELIARPLWVEDGRFTITEERITKDGKVNLNLEWRTVPTIQVKKTNGDTYARPLTRGSFNARVSIIHKYIHKGDEVRVILGTSEKLRYSMINSSLAMNFLVPTSKLPDRGQLMLGLELDPVDAPESIKAFQGIYLLGEYHAVKPNTFLRLHSIVSQTPGFKITDYASQNVDAFLATHKDADDNIYRTPGVEADPIKFPYGFVVSETTTRKTIAFGVQVCLKSGVDWIPVRSHTFKIKGFLPNNAKDGSKRLITTRTSENNGCFQWQEQYDFNVNECQHFIPGKVVISNDDLGMNKEYSVMVNVWDPMAGNIGKDMRWIGKDEVHVTDCAERPRRQIKLENLGYSHSGATYSIDNSLNLTFSKSYIMKMDAFTNTYSNLFAGRDEARQNLRDGTYLFRAAIIRHRDFLHPDNENIYVSSAEKLVVVNKGQVNAEIAFATRDLKGVANNNILLMDINPVDEKLLADHTDTDGNPLPKDPKAKLSDLIYKDSLLDSPVFMGTINMHIDDGNRSLKPLKNDTLTSFFIKGRGDLISNQQNIIPEIVAKGKKYMEDAAAASAAKHTLQYYAQSKNLELININRKVQDAVREKMKISTFGGSTESNIMNNLYLKQENLQAILNTGRLSSFTASKLCNLWFSDYFAKPFEGKAPVVPQIMRDQMTTECMIKVRKDPSSFFKVDRYLRAKEIEAPTANVRGYNKGLTVNAGFSWSNSHSKTESTSHSIATKRKFIDFLGIGTDYAYQMSWNQANSAGNGNSIGVTTQESMSVAYTRHPIIFKKYQLCATVHLNPDNFIDEASIWLFNSHKNYTRYLNHTLTQAERERAITRGLLLCEEQDRIKPITREETYYILSQEGYVQMQATGDDRNRQFFAALRSDSDFVNFVVATKAETHIPLTAGVKEDIMAGTTQVLRTLFHAPTTPAPSMYRLQDMEDLGNTK